MKQLVTLSLVLSLMSLPFGNITMAASATKANDNESAGITIPKGWTEAQESQKSLITPTLISTFPDKTWWQQFQDANLVHYIDLALSHNPSIQIAMARIDQAQAMVQGSKAHYWPTLSTGSSYYHLHLPQGSTILPRNLNLYTIPLQAAYEIDLFGKYRDQVKSSKLKEASTQLDRQSIALSLIGDVASAYFNLIRMDALVQIQTQDLALLKHIDELKSSQYGVGLTAYDEVLRAERDVAEAQTNLTHFTQQQALFAHQLSVLTGSPPQDLSSLTRTPIDQFALPQEVHSGLPSALLVRRPDILSQERLLESSKIDVTVARKAFLPTINLSAMAGLGALKLSKLFSVSNNYFALGSIALSQPIFQGGKLKANLNLKKAQQKEQFATYQQIILNAFKDVEDNLALLRTDYESLGSTQERLNLTRNDYKLTESLYSQGLIPHLSVLQSQVEVDQYRQLGIQSKADALIATVGLYKALGGGF